MASPRFLLAAVLAVGFLTQGSWCTPATVNVPEIETNATMSSSASVPANVELVGVNSEWINALGYGLVYPNSRGGWIPVNHSAWANTTDPFNSHRVNNLLNGLRLGNYRYHPHVSCRSMVGPYAHRSLGRPMHLLSPLFMASGYMCACPDLWLYLNSTQCRERA